MIKRLAVFVEGLTEQEFTIRLLTELAGKHTIEFEIHRQNKGALSLLELRSPDQSAVIHVLIANCCNDGQVKSQIKEQHISLKSAGYSLIVGLRDVYPLKFDEIAKLEEHLLTGLPTDGPPIVMHLAIMEIEAWFLEEITHFPRIDSKITKDHIVANGYDHQSVHACNLPHPAETLDKIYKSVGKRYTKNKNHICRTINALSFEELYLNTRQKVPSLEKFVASLEAWLFSTAT